MQRTVLNSVGIELDSFLRESSILFSAYRYIFTQELYEVYIDGDDSSEGAMESMDGIRTDLEERISCLNAALDKVRNEPESRRKTVRQSTRRMPSELLAHQNAHTDFWRWPA